MSNLKKEMQEIKGEWVGYILRRFILSVNFQEYMQGKVKVLMLLSLPLDNWRKTWLIKVAFEISWL